MISEYERSRTCEPFGDKTKTSAILFSILTPNLRPQTDKAQTQLENELM